MAMKRGQTPFAFRRNAAEKCDLFPALPLKHHRLRADNRPVTDPLFRDF
jgi:hypothetical protein